MPQLFRLGQTIDVDDIVGELLPVLTTDRNIRSFEVNREEKQAFVYKGKNGTYTVTGILAVDKKKKVLKLARPLRRCVEKHESQVFQFAEGAELILPDPEDLTLFRKYYRHCPHFADVSSGGSSTVLPCAETAAESPHAETAAVMQHAETAAVLPCAETAADAQCAETVPHDAAC
jgi:hypothetical protein